MSTNLAAKLARAVQSLSRDLAVASHRADELPDYLDPLIREMREAIDALERRRHDLKASAGSAVPAERPTWPDSIQKREVVIETLGLLGRPAFPTVVSRAAMLSFGVDVKPSQFASMRKGDERAYLRGRRTRIILVPALSAADLTARPRIITLSDWEPERRIIGQFSERVDALRVILRLADLQERQPDLDWPSVLRPLAQDFRLPVERSNDIRSLADGAHRQLEDIEAKDLEERREAAVRAARLPEIRRLFGAFTPIDDAGDLV